MPATFFLHLGLALAISAVLIGLGMFRRTRSIAVILSIIFMLLLFVPLFRYPLLRWIGVILCPTLLISLRIHASPRTTLILCGLPLLLILGFTTQDRIAEVARIGQLRSRFPVESLAARLAFEDKHPPADAAIVLPPDLTSELNQNEEEIVYVRSFEGRGIRLKLLHDENYREFVATSGFGFARTKPNSLHQLELPEPEPVPMPNHPVPTDSYLKERQREREGLAIADSLPSPDTQTEGRDIHDSARHLFLNPRQWGFVPDREHTVGFQAHHVDEVPWTRPLYKGQTRNWTIAQLQLVSLLKQETPRVYVSENLPNLNELSDIETREVNTFEATALPQLRRDRNLVIDEAPSQIQMLGALRAAKSCLDCHRVPQGELLGAFSYVLVRVP